MTAVAVIAWMGLVGWGVADAWMSAPTAAHHHHGGHPMGAGHPGGGWAWTFHWLLMVIAMMWPLYGGVVAAITTASYRRWRVITVGVFVVVITALWLLFGLTVRAAYLVVQGAVPAWMWSLGWLAVAIVVTRSMWRAHLLRTCRRVRVLAPAGRRAIITAADTAARSWPRCVVLCGPVMVAMVAAHQLPLMIGGSAAVWWEQRHPHAWRDPVPVTILVATAALLLGTYLWKGAL